MNVVGMVTLLRREISRFVAVPAQAFLQPLVTSSLYFGVFGGALASRLETLPGIPYARFITPGLMMLTLINGSYTNCAGSVFVAKNQGSIVDLLAAPLSPLDMIAGFIPAGILRGVISAGLVWLMASLFTGFHVAHPGWALAFMVLVGATFGLIGLAAAINADRLETLNLVPTLLITPMTFFGGVFYTATMLPAPWSTLTRFNPVLYMVDGLRYGMLGTAGESPWIGLTVVAGLFLVALGGVWWILATGYKLRP